MEALRQRARSGTDPYGLCGEDMSCGTGSVSGRRCGLLALFRPLMRPAGSVQASDATGGLRSGLRCGLRIERDTVQPDLSANCWNYILLKSC